MTAGAENLQELERRAAFELDCLAYPAREWVKARQHGDRPVLDVLIVGGGQNGITIAFRLLRERVTNIRVLDRSDEGAEGPWLTFARMHHLRTPKEVTGPDLGVPSLSARAWYEAQFGADSWTGLGKIPRELWARYLAWLRRVAGIDVTHHAEVDDIEPIAGGLFAVTATIDGAKQALFARNIVLATGMEGSGRWIVPDMIERAVPRDRYHHTSEAIDFKALANRRVAVVGAGASAFDNAATALEHGAAAVDLYCRRPQLPVINPNRWIEFAGFLRHFADLDDAMKWRFMKLIFDMNQPPPQDAFRRCARFTGFALHLGSPIQHVGMVDDAIELHTPGGVSRADHLIAGTGFAIDFAARPELGRIGRYIARWSDRYPPPAGEESLTLAGYPYLSHYFQFTEKVPGTAPYLKNIFCYTYAAMPSLACSAGISQLKFGVDRVGFGLTRELFLDDAPSHLAGLREYRDPELDASSYAAPGDDAAAAVKRRVSG
ncbi:MAG TPA: NAD(P)/FAD-dependent oxidoreductase [Xanthobacteraceae bacterium]|nr:NAD(P)/FAD-dependent oxidoreductase [Xanthobacteraceae bacterium]